MPRGRKRKIEFIPVPWIRNSSSEDEENQELPERVLQHVHDVNPGLQQGGGQRKFFIFSVFFSELKLFSIKINTLYIYCFGT